MFHQILIYFTFALVLTTGLPQLHFHSGGLTVIENGKDQKDSPGPSKTSAPSGGQMLQIVPPGKGAPELTGHILFQVFIGSGNSDSDLVKVHESNSTFPISMAALDKTRDSKKGCPASDQLIYEPDGKCYQVGDFTPGRDSPCPTPMKTYQKRHDKPGYGECFCVRFVTTTRPVVYWADNDECYWLFDQGPCKAEEWLVLSNKEVEGYRRPKCSKRNCTKNIGKEEDFWFEHKGKCYQTGTQNQDICSKPNEKIYFAREKPVPDCSEIPIVPVTTRGIGSGAGYLGCKPGFKPTPTHECKQIATFDFD